MTEFSTTAILEDLQREMEIFAKDQEIDWNSLVSSIEDVMTRLKEIFFSPGKEAREESEKLSKARIGITAELKKIHSRKFHDLLAQASILPIYGFPVDVVQLFTQKMIPVSGVSVAIGYNGTVDLPSVSMHQGRKSWLMIESTNPSRLSALLN